MVFTELMIFGKFTGIGQVYGDQTPLVIPEGGTVYGRELPLELCAALPGQSPDLSSDASAASSNHSTCRAVS